MLKSESVDETLTRFIKITNGLSSLGDTIDNDQKIRKVIIVLPKSWEMKATTLKELNDREKMDFSDFIINLKIHEMEMKVQEEREPPKKKTITFRASLSKFERLAKWSTKKENEQLSKIKTQERNERKKRRDRSMLSLQEDGIFDWRLSLSTSNLLKKSIQEEGHTGPWDDSKNEMRKLIQQIFASWQMGMTLLRYHLKPLSMKMIWL